MNEILTSAGLISIVLAVLYSVKKIYDFIDLQKVTRKDIYENYDIYKAAQKFALGTPVDEIREILTNSYELDDNQVEETMFLALPHRNDTDGGYLAFIKAVNRVLEQEVYS
ncbi:MULTISPECIES: hypothetical protein [Paenibacillus]|uniref:Uncharacterized protein n=2 Tax=Paenibacillus TaxID=44249 RepID=A0AAJ3J0A1_PAEPO|nr:MULTISPECIES: hypothetical protein [Paenibacillus]APB75878.1 hypothetical protein PPYC2_13265 [Paenibacillus polymyxa]MDH2331576.1 hypothetical protein [Paenibacillus polymyxa]MDR6775946.1 hypothetical protein [Paenibacillus peoriae]ODA09164.1 hypothetical protein A7312_27075 [Paenibacillus polymyxa]ODB63101.1 hypothetical protein A7309_11460 [Paenibacillus polymyxa]